MFADSLTRHLLLQYPLDLRSIVFRTCNPCVAVGPPQGLNIPYIHYCSVAVTVQPEIHI